jgi:hypothetical protein
MSDAGASPAAGLRKHAVFRARARPTRGLPLAVQGACRSFQGAAPRRAPAPAAASLALVLVIAGSTPAPVAAQDSAVRLPHVRPENKDAARFVDEAAHKSEAIRALIDRLYDSDVTVYVRFRPLTDVGGDGRMRFLSATANQRYLVIDLACVRTRIDQIAIFGHELHHALEIADTPSIVNAATMAAHYERAGFETGLSAVTRTFETHAARATAETVRKQVVAATSQRGTDGQ